MNDEDYSKWIDGRPTAEARVESIMRESRFVTNWFPAYSSGAGDLIADLLDDLRTEWANEAASPEKVD
ncbi:MAG TPA: hypothetical protein VGR71_01255 [Nitrospira sp.]|nr:hypothetical protein [Nitrospira sp.]